MTITTLPYEVFDDLPTTDKAWAQWRAIVESEEWTSDDHSCMTLTMQLDTTHSVVATDKDGNFVGSVVWNEYDNIAFLGFYILREEHRGKGIGSIIWRRAINRMPKDYTIALRAVPYMAPRYQSMDTPVEGPKLNEYFIPWAKCHELSLQMGNRNGIVKSYDSLTPEERNKYEAFDKKITGKDRTEFLKKFHAFPFTNGNVLFNENGVIKACAAIAHTCSSVVDKHYYKIGPIYADSLEDAFTVSERLVKWAGERDPKAIILFHIVEGSRGEAELLPVIEPLSIETRYTGITLFSKELPNPIDMTKVYLAHNNSAHYDV